MVGPRKKKPGPRKPSHYKVDPISGYRPAYNKIARQLSLLGATADEMADAFDVDRATVYSWRQLYPAFDKSIKDGQVAADAKVAAALYKRAIGYSVKEDQLHVIDKKVVATPIIKHIQPDVSAQKTWLHVRRRLKPPKAPDAPEQPTSWAETKELSGPEGQPLIPTRSTSPKLEALTNEQIDALVALVGEISMEPDEDGEN